MATAKRDLTDPQVQGPLPRHERRSSGSTAEPGASVQAQASQVIDLTEPKPVKRRRAREVKATSGSLPQLLTVQELADILRVPPEYVTRRLVFERRIKFIKVGRRTLFDQTDVKNFLAERTVTPGE